MEFLLHSQNNIKLQLGEFQKLAECDEELNDLYHTLMHKEAIFFDNLTRDELEVVDLVVGLEQLYHHKDLERQNKIRSWLYYVIRDLTKTNFLLNSKNEDFLRLFDTLKKLDISSENIHNDIGVLACEFEQAFRAYDEDGKPIIAPLGKKKRQ